VLSKEQLYEALVEGGGVTREEFMKAAQSRSAKTKGIDSVLVSDGSLTEAQLGQLVASWFGVRHFDPAQTKPQDDVILLVPEAFARKKHLLPISQTEDSVVLAVTNPHDVTLQALLEKYLRREVVFYYSTEREILSNLFLFQKDPKVAFKNILEGADLNSDDSDGVVVKLVNAIFDYSYQTRTSDVHIEPEDEFTQIRFRIDGILQDIAEFPKKIHDPVITRLKVLSKLATDEKRAAQDGRISYTNDFGDKIDIRLSIVPTTNGEKAVMRLLAAKTRQFSLTDLGLSEAHFELFKKAIKKPWGMILVTGPTGSGKSTTLYAALKVLNKREVNIATIEDPVEYDVDGISQIQVNPKTNLTFAKGLRSIVRQDPDIIMVGEIRDGETADISVNPAMTGHFVFSSLHTNDAATAFPRLKDMGVEDFLVSSTILVVIAQRLVRRICLNCIKSVNISEQELKTINHLPHLKKYFSDVTGKKSLSGIRVFHGQGCKICKNTGYKGRTGIFELLAVTDEIREAVMSNKDADQVKEIAVKQGMSTMLFDGVQKILTGETTLEEVLRVTQE